MLLTHYFYTTPALRSAYIFQVGTIIQGAFTKINDLHNRLFLAAAA